MLSAGLYRSIGAIKHRRRVKYKGILRDEIIKPMRHRACVTNGNEIMMMIRRKMVIMRI